MERCVPSRTCDSVSVAAGVSLHRRVLHDRADRVRHADEVLHDAVVEVAGDAAALVVAGVERLLQQGGALALGVPHAPGQRPRQRELHQLEQDERAEQQRGEHRPDAVGALR